ncbi:MAG TPA: hypothetical protein VNO30_06155 [Kofleriaceae bacterium]|nr:hypothetical protein [Kofleriaceae bacterium]
MSRSLSRSLARFVLTGSLVAALASSAAADRAGPSFAKPPAGWMSARMDVEDDPAVIERATVRAKLREQRAANLARFRAYRTAGVYPSNVYTPGLANVWRDQEGHFCAAATIIRASGRVSLVEATAAQNNSIRLADVSSGPLFDWILTSGLTQDEIALIQRPFMPVTKRPAIEPARPIVVDAQLRAAETRRLARLYAEIEGKLIASEGRSLELATERLMARPELAQQLIGG